MNTESPFGTRGTLLPNEPHPASKDAQIAIAKLSQADLNQWREAFASCAIEGNRLAEICGETLERLMTGQPVSDRYLLGLAWTMEQGLDTRNKSS